MTSAKKDSAIAIRITKSFTGVAVRMPRLRRLVTAVCKRFRVRGDREAYQISVAIVDDAQITKLNARFLGRNAVTDCLSFDLSDSRAPRAGGPSQRTLDVIVNGELAVRQAALRGHSAEAELALYITHGLLHQLGFDDCTASKARKMHDAEDAILQELGYGAVYNSARGQARGPAPTV